MPNFTLEERDAAWIRTAPIVMTNEFKLSATPDLVFARLAALGEWSDWFRGMKKIRLDGPAAGEGALRTVWVGLHRVQEHFIVWEPGHRIAFAVIGSSTPGLRSMVEDWVLTPDPEAPPSSLTTTLAITVGIEAATLLRPFSGLVRATLKGPLRGAAGITTQFP